MEYKWWHITKTYVSPDFDHLDLPSAVLQFTLPSASCTANAGNNMSHKSKSHVSANFNLLDLTNVMMPLLMPLASYHANASAKCIT